MGRNIEAELEKLGLSFSEFGRLIGRYPSQARLIAKGASEAMPDTAERISQILKAGCECCGRYLERKDEGIKRKKEELDVP